MKEATYYQRNRETILNTAKEYDKSSKERLREQARNKYRKLSDEEKIYGRNRYYNMFKENKQRLKE